jgi:hypothetical protein
MLVATTQENAKVARLRLLRLKRKSEWDFLIKLGVKNGLNVEQNIFLIALREYIDGGAGNEFGVKAVCGTNLEEQALWAIGSIKKNERRWHEYLLDNGHIDYITFFCFMGGPFGVGWFKVKEAVDKLNHYCEIIKENYCGFKTANQVGD